MVRINLLPVRVSKKKEAGQQQLILFVLVLVFGIIANWLWIGSRTSELDGRKRKLTSTQNEIAQLERIIGEVKNIKDQQSQLREKLDVLGQLKQGRTGPVRMLDELATVMPRRLWLTKLDEKGGTVTLVGTAATIDDVSELMSALRASSHFRNVELAKTSSKVDKGLRVVDFTLSTQVAYAMAPAADAKKPADGKGK
ncbi:MAG: PilN domain-containing protein [Anaeromyxobacteraceae bacterium]